MSTNTVDVAAAVSNVFLSTDELQQQINQLQTLNKQLTWQLDQERRFERQKNFVVRRIFKAAKEEDLPTGYDTDAMYDRIVELVADDDDDVWATEQEYEVTITYTVKVKGTVSAKSEEDARELVEDSYPDLDISNEGGLSNPYIYDSTVEDTEIDE